MKKILLLVSSFLILCMAGSAMGAYCTLVNSTTNTALYGDLSLANGDPLGVKLSITDIDDDDLNIP